MISTPGSYAVDTLDRILILQVLENLTQTSWNEQASALGQKPIGVYN